MQSPGGFPSPYGIGYPQAAISPSLGQITPGPLGTYPFGSLPAGQSPPILPTPGPTALGPGTVQGSLGTGVNGVGIAPISSVTPPATAGGPHQLPPLPPAPLPQGFPNPFETGPAAVERSNETAPFTPGTTTYTGPQGYLPGLGFFGRPGQGSGPGMPGPLAGQSAGTVPAAGPLPQASPPQTGPIGNRAAPPSGAQPAPQRQSVSPFWLALAWQMLQTPAADRTMGDRLRALMNSDDRVRAILTGANLLLTPEMQSAFRAMASGEMQQTPFTELFASRVAPALQQSGLLRAG